MSNQTQAHPAASIREAIDDNVVIFDTTLRDGEQSPGCSMTTPEKIRVAETLEAMRVDVIEAGFPIASEGDFEAVNEISKRIKESVVCGLARAAAGDIDRAAEALKPAARRRIHTFIGTSPLHREFQLQLDKEQVHQRIIDSVSRARRYTDDVEWSGMDASRTEHDYLFRCVETAINCGATTINIPDTVGYAYPEEFADLIRAILNNVPNIDKAVLSVHCHNDLGLATANSILAVKAGARQIECTINGIGERAGNTALEEVVMAFKTRGDLLPFKSRIVSQDIMKASRLVSAITGFKVQPNKAIVGANAFSHESGIHQDGVLKNAATYEIMKPEDVGLIKTSLVMGKHSGRHAFKKKLEELGYVLGDNALNEAFIRFKALADKKKEVFDEDIVALVDDEIAGESQRIRIKDLDIVCGTKRRPHAEIVLEVDGQDHVASADGDGPVDSAFRCVQSIVAHKAELEVFTINAITEGIDAQATVTVRLAEGGKSVVGQAADTDIVVASIKAYVAALNKLLVKRERTAPAALSA
ncbi:2-isopropylmalate synthase [Arboricoccus pini]|uniref:2-isopropylmalate synthase n=1 Tax=Arboricoccus pini TaxID=1963835 RepID=A0A212QQ70_9PROT|nr:2-isopropylmalate synthase [Arboricoccus pini]SNB61421.1 2-isopropylmalate synthase [Arboricoccus pini]